MKYLSDTALWYLIHVLFPCSPFFISALIHISVAQDTISSSTFNASSLSISLGLSSFVVFQNIVNKEIILSNKEKNREKKFCAFCYFYCSIVFLVCFGVFEGITKYNPNDGNIKIKLQVIIFILFVIYSILSWAVQKKLKLDTKLFWEIS
jgi:hypothetical protein